VYPGICQVEAITPAGLIQFLDGRSPVEQLSNRKNTVQVVESLAGEPGIKDRRKAEQAVGLQKSFL
jgi:hypothetical protein